MYLIQFLGCSGLILSLLASFVFALFGLQEDAELSMAVGVGVLLVSFVVASVARIIAARSRRNRKNS